MLAQQAYAEVLLTYISHTTYSNPCTITFFHHPRLPQNSSLGTWYLLQTSRSSAVLVSAAPSRPHLAGGRLVVLVLDLHTRTLLLPGGRRFRRCCRLCLAVRRVGPIVLANRAQGRQVRSGQVRANGPTIGTFTCIEMEGRTVAALTKTELEDRLNFD